MLHSIREGSRLTVCLAGELDHFCAQSVRRELDRLIADPAVRTLILDFSALQFMDSSGIGVILGRYRQMRDRGGSVCIANMNRHIARIFHMSGMDRIIRQISIPQEAAQV